MDCSVRARLEQLKIGKEDGVLSISIDFGTSYSQVSYIKGKTVDIRHIKEVSNWPSASYGGLSSSLVTEVPSESMYGLQSTIFGYDVRKELERSAHTGRYRLCNIKLLLDESSESQKLREELHDKISVINSSRVSGQKPISVYDIVHGKNIYTPGDDVHFVLPIPEMWNTTSKWIMQKALTEVTKDIQFGSTRNLFFTAESESALTSGIERLESVWSAKSETIVVCDAGGGTTDVVTTKVANVRPYRFKRVAQSKSRCVGSSFLDINFRTYLAARVKYETYLDEIENGNTIAELLDLAVLNFHNFIKRRFDGDINGPGDFVKFGDLAPSEAKGFSKGTVNITARDLEEIFLPLCDKVWDMIELQIQQAQLEGQPPSKVLLVGGFGNSNFLQRRIEEKLARKYDKIELLHAEHFIARDSTGLVSSGSLYRSLHRNYGLTRITQSGFGVLHNQIFRENFEGHNGGDTFVDIDNRTYVNNCIYYLFKPGQEIRAGKKRERYVMWGLVRDGHDLNVRVPFYMSGRECTDNYHLKHTKNTGAVKIGELVFDLTWTEILKHSAFKKNEVIHPIKYEVVITINGLGMEYEICHPIRGQLRAEGHLEITAAFDLNASEG